jgi:hypothetical protein
MAMCKKMPFDAVVKLARTSWDCVHALCKEYVDLTVGKFAADASKAVDDTRRSERKTDPYLKGLRRALFKDREP